MNTKKWVISSFIYTTIFIVSIITFNMWLDPYAIIHTDKRNFVAQPNINYLKTNYIISNPSKYENFIFGGSRVGNISPFYMNEPIFYNMTYPDAIPEEALDNLQTFLKNGVKIKTVLLGLDEFSTQISYKKRQLQGLTRAYPKENLIDWMKLYIFYFFKFPNKQDISVFKHRVIKHTPGQAVAIEDQKKFYSTLSVFNNIIEKDVVKHNLNKKFNKITLHKEISDHAPLDDITEIIDLCQKNDIRLIIFFNPIHHLDYKNFDLRKYNDLKSELEKITSYYDFSEPSNISKNNYYFYEPAHYRPLVGNLILDKIFFDKQFEDFGVFRPKI